LAEGIPQATVAKEPGRRGEHEVTVKTIAQGRPDVFGEPVVTMLVCFFISHARLRVHRAPGFPCALYFLKGNGWSTTRAQSVPRDREAAFVSTGTKLSLVIARESGRSSIPEAAGIEPRGRGVLDTPHARGMTGSMRRLLQGNDGPIELVINPFLTIHRAKIAE